MAKIKLSWWEYDIRTMSEVEKYVLRLKTTLSIWSTFSDGNVTDKIKSFGV